MTDTEAQYIQALIALHIGLDHQGPGDPAFTQQMVAQLPPFTMPPRIADLGCGAGASTLVLAAHFRAPVQAVDFAAEFLAQLDTRAAQAGLADFIQTECADIGALTWPAGQLDLLWSEGAAYNLGFATALQTWRSLLSDQGIAVISELSWFSDTPPEPARAYWQEAYPQLGTETENCDRAVQAGYQVLFTERLPRAAWWQNYYNPLRDRLAQLDPTPINQTVRAETETEIALFEQWSDHYGYTFYALQAKPSI